MKATQPWPSGIKLLLPAAAAAGILAAVADKVLPAVQMSWTRGYEPGGSLFSPTVFPLFLSNAAFLLSAAALAWAGIASSSRLLKTLLPLVAALSVFAPYVQSGSSWALPAAALVLVLGRSVMAARGSGQERVATALVGLSLLFGHLWLASAAGGWAGALDPGVLFAPAAESTAALAAVATFWVWGMPLDRLPRWIAYASLGVSALFLAIVGNGGYAGPASLLAASGISLAIYWLFWGAAVFLLSFATLASFARGDAARGLGLLLLPVVGLQPASMHQALLGVLALTLLAEGEMVGGTGLEPVTPSV